MNCSTGFLCYAATYYDVSPTDIDESDLPGVLLQSLKNNIKFCDTQNLGQKKKLFLKIIPRIFSSISTSPLYKLILAT